jgi:hypothetical protein
MKVARKILAILRRAGSFLAKRTDSNTAKTSTAGPSDRRRTRRVSVFVYGRTAGGDPFHEEAYTILVNGNGGLLSMSSRVRPGQRLVVTNQGNDQTELCVVVSVEPRVTDRSKIALKFPKPAPKFWRGLEIGSSPNP